MSNADRPWTVSYDKRLGDDELDVLERLENSAPSATMSMSAYWTFHIDEKMRKLYQLRNAFRSSEGYLEMSGSLPLGAGSAGVCRNFRKSCHQRGVSGGSI
jgi:hypothetical protein